MITNCYYSTYNRTVVISHHAFSAEQRETQRIRKANEEALAKWLATP